MRTIRNAALMLSALGAATLLSTSANAQIGVGENYPWCAYYSSIGGQNCGFVTYEQCMATVRGIGGFCDRNPTYYEYDDRRYRRRYRQRYDD